MFYSTFLTFHVIIAVLTTGHALLNKRDIRAAIGWIGLTWLSPGLGAGLYYAFGINRVARRAVKSADAKPVTALHVEPGKPCPPGLLSDHMIMLSEVGKRLTGEELAPGNRVNMLQNGDDAYPKMIAEIEEAKTSVCLATYIFRSDEVGERFADALIAAQHRGVEVRVLIDAWGSGFFLSRTVSRLRENGVHVARFMFDHKAWSVAFINLRNHKKLLLIDGARSYVGGLNLGAENTMQFFGARQVRDIHFNLEGPVVAQLMKSFVRDWIFTTGEDLRGPVWWPNIPVCGDASCRAFSSGPDDDMRKIETLFAVALSTARSHVRIVTPYFLPDEKLVNGLRLAALRGVRVEVILPERSDHLFIDWAMRSHLSFLRIHGLHCYFSTSAFDHAKLITIDNAWCAFGSPNWDVRSLRLNFELVVECYTKSVVAAIDTVIAQKRDQARPLSFQELSERPLPVKLRDATARLFLPYL